MKKKKTLEGQRFQLHWACIQTVEIKKKGNRHMNMGFWDQTGLRTLAPLDCWKSSQEGEDCKGTRMRNQQNKILSSWFTIKQNTQR